MLLFKDYVWKCHAVGQPGSAVQGSKFYFPGVDAVVVLLPLGEASFLPTHTEHTECSLGSILCPLSRNT